MKQAVLKTLVIRGLKTAWLQQDGDATSPIVIFLHGCPDDAQTWRELARHFATKGCTTLSPYARGMGASTAAADPARYTRDAIALDNLAILREVDPDARRKIIVVGHDIGGIHAWKLARLLGPRLSALILINGPDLAQMAGRLTHARQLAKSWYIALFQLPLVAELVLARGEALLLARARAKGAMPAGEGVAIAPFLPQYRAAGRELPSVLLNREAPLDAPVLVLWGKDDAFLETPTRAEYDRLALHVTIRVLGGGHWIHRESPERIGALMDGFLSEVL